MSIALTNANTTDNINEASGDSHFGFSRLGAACVDDAQSHSSDQTTNKEEQNPETCEKFDQPAEGQVDLEVFV